MVKQANGGWVLAPEGERQKRMFPNKKCDNTSIHQPHTWLSQYSVDGIPTREQAFCDGVWEQEEKPTWEEIIDAQRYEYAVQSWVDLDKGMTPSFRIIRKIISQAGDWPWYVFVENVGTDKDAAYVMVNALNVAEKEKDNG